MALGFTKSTDIVYDQEFGEIKIRRVKNSRSIRLKMDQRGFLSISMPRFTSLKESLRLVEMRRDFIRGELSKIKQKQITLSHGDLIGKTHKLIVNTGDSVSSRLSGIELSVTLTPNLDPLSPEGQKIIKTAAIKALRTQAKAYLPRKLENLARQHGFNYKFVRYSNAGTRWGSCSTGGTISLNIWLMQLPFELIDYVLVHELCHTRHMNHSPDFWDLVESIMPNSKTLKKELKTKSPYL